MSAGRRGSPLLRGFGGCVCEGQWDDPQSHPGTLLDDLGRPPPPLRCHGSSTLFDGFSSTSTSRPAHGIMIQPPPRGRWTSTPLRSWRPRRKEVENLIDPYVQRDRPGCCRDRRSELLRHRCDHSHRDYALMSYGRCASRTSGPATLPRQSVEPCPPSWWPLRS